MNPLVSLACTAFFSYLIGSIPTAVWVSKQFFGFDIRTKGSGNMGSTNAMRVLGAKWGSIVQIIDVLKGVVPVIMLPAFFFDFTGNSETLLDNAVFVKMVAGLFAVLGHVFSVFVGFKGGKGINTAAGVLMGIAPIEFAVVLTTFLLALFSSGYVSLGSVLAGVMLPIALIFRHEVFKAQIPGYSILLPFFILLSILVVYTHRSNIRRLLKGTENHFPKAQIFRRK
ncbi:MAG TPA: glycerol-3-phosphate 1-O-acyltransferase PlsY [Patescibacteria group bacterium]|nr:glycerol-3-phosphate 1-O-acyltransferase PlsY [Patescibacteria group bacterium]